MTNNDIAILEKIAQGATAEEIGKCTKVYDFQARANIYLVENSHGHVDDQGNIAEYTVRYSKKLGFTCTCLAGSYGFANCPNYCWHVRASVACSIEEIKALAEIARQEEDRKVVQQPIEVRWNIPAWMLERPVAPHMSKSPREK